MQKLRLTDRTGAFAVRHRLPCVSPASPCGPFTVELFAAEGLSLGPRARHARSVRLAAAELPALAHVERTPRRNDVWPGPRGRIGQHAPSRLHGHGSPQRENRSHEFMLVRGKLDEARSRCLTDFVIHGRAELHRAVCLGRPASEARDHHEIE